MAQQFVTGAVAGAVATTVTYPLDLLRTRFAAQGGGGGGGGRRGSHHDERVYKSLAHAIQQIYNQERLSGFFRGLRPAVSQIVPYMGFFFATYEPCKRVIDQQLLADKHHDSYLQASKMIDFSSEALAGMVAGTISKTGVFPLDVIRKRMQVQGPTRTLYILKSIPNYPNSIMACVKTIIAHEGVRGLYRGLMVSLLKAAPNSAITMWMFEHSIKSLRWFEHQIDSSF
ncbi:mitochondrial carrier domain-containing protein [Lipomyces japonicus]|uniref:mitochondrial carrier domain-containing protein n=1 Tax=Lipomyces japonicus TaxID=56871 RepID=UPI0034CF787C